MHDTGKRETENMIPIGMRDQQGQRSTATAKFALHQFITQHTKAGTGIEDNQFTLITGYCGTAGIAAVT
jgi:hypothetical protein